MIEVHDIGQPLSRCKHISIINYIIITMVKTTCKKCNYTWNYNGKLMRRTCPNCGYNWIVKRGRPAGSKTIINNEDVVSIDDVMV